MLHCIPSQVSGLFIFRHKLNMNSLQHIGALHLCFSLTYQSLLTQCQLTLPWGTSSPEHLGHVEYSILGTLGAQCLPACTEQRVQVFIRPVPPPMDYSKVILD